MTVNIEAYERIRSELGEGVTLVAVSKKKSISDIQELYDLGHRDFGENYVQELIQKQLLLPNDIKWHFIGHLQRNKVKYLAPFVHLIHGVDSYQLLEEINRQAEKNNRIMNTLLQIHVATEETKFGLDGTELITMAKDLHKYKLLNQLENVTVCGLMGMASQTEDSSLINKEFSYLKTLFDDATTIIRQGCFNILSMGMSSDYKIALKNGSNMVRIGSLLFGERN
ncbi:MAG: YggS family pyridoxal phosphate-dependent enzyme [Chitinophagaceae bacterium]|nr:YggS family pyridoxal phosphate-dependent enzyme [Chitinophagaceae bacterium]